MVSSIFLRTCTSPLTDLLDPLVTSYDSFEGAIQVVRINQSDRAFYYDVTFFLDHPHLIKLASAEKPPMHFHPYQEEYVQVLEGTLGLEIEKTEYRLKAEDGQFLIKPWANHRLYPIIDDTSNDYDGNGKAARFLLSGEKSRMTFQLDDLFFQNWYSYQEEVVMSNKKFDIIQIMNVRFFLAGSRSSRIYFFTIAYV
jgi:hypothetical protein